MTLCGRVVKATEKLDELPDVMGEVTIRLDNSRTTVNLTGLSECELNEFRKAARNSVPVVIKTEILWQAGDLSAAAKSR